MMLIVKAKIKMRDGSLSETKRFVLWNGKYYDLEVVFTQPPIPEESLDNIGNVFIVKHVLQELGKPNKNDDIFAIDSLGDRVAHSMKLGSYVKTPEEDRALYHGRID